MMAGTGSAPDDAAAALEPQIEAIERTLEGAGPTERRQPAQLVGARYWGPGRFRLALQEVAQFAHSTSSCLMCYESDWRTCHRRRVAEILARRHGFTVCHLAVGAELAEGMT